MSLYNDGYSARAVLLSTGLANDTAKGVFTQTSTNNLLDTDTLQVGNTTLTIVNTLGSTPGTVKKGSNWVNTMTNVINALAASVSGSGATANYVPSATVADTVGEFNGSTHVNFFARAAGAAGSGFPSVYTASGTAGGSFAAATFVSPTQGITRAIDWTIGLGLSLQFEVTAAILTPAVFQVWGDTRDASNPCNASGVGANQLEIVDGDLCNSLSGPSDPMVVTIPVTQTITATNIQGFLETTNIAAVGSVYQGRPRCFNGLPFIFVKAMSGDTQNLNITALVSRLKRAN